MIRNAPNHSKGGLIKRFERQFLISIVFGVVIFLLLTIYANAGELRKAFSEFNAVYVPLVLFLAFSNYLMRYLRWEYYLKRLEINIDKSDSFIVFMSGLTMSVTPGKFGELLKSYLLKKLQDVSVSVSAPIIFAERFTDFTALVLLCFSGILIFRHGLIVLILSIGLVLLFLLVFGNEKIARKLIGFLSTRQFLAKFSSKLDELYTNMRVLVGSQELLVGTFIGVLSWSCECIAFYIVLAGFNNSFPLFHAFFIYSFATIAGALSMLPGGVGATEGSITFLLVSAGVSKAIGVASTFIIRVCTLWFALGVGLVFLFLFRERFSGMEQILDEEISDHS